MWEVKVADMSEGLLPTCPHCGGGNIEETCLGWLTGVPEDNPNHATCLVCGWKGRSIAAQLKSYRVENKRLRQRLNHQTPDDIEACRQGKHPPDCGAKEE